MDDVTVSKADDLRLLELRASVASVVLGECPAHHSHGERVALEGESSLLARDKRQRLALVRTRAQVRRHFRAADHDRFAVVQRGQAAPVRKAQRDRAGWHPGRSRGS